MDIFQPPVLLLYILNRCRMAPNPNGDITAQYEELQHHHRHLRDPSGLFSRPETVMDPRQDMTPANAKESRHWCLDQRQLQGRPETEAKVPSKRDGEVPQLQRPPSPSEPANPVPVEAPMNRPSNNGDQLQSINDGPVPIVAALPTPDSGTPVPEFPRKIRDRGKLSSRRDLPVPTPLQQEPAIKIPDGDIPVPGRIPTPPPPPPMATFPRGALYGGNVPPKRDGLAAGLTPPPAPAREPEIPFYRFPDSGTSVPEFSSTSSWTYSWSEQRR